MCASTVSTSSDPVKDPVKNEVSLRTYLTYRELVEHSKAATRRWHTNVVGDEWNGYLIASTFSRAKVDAFNYRRLQYSPGAKAWFADTPERRDAGLAELARLTPARQILTSSAGLVPLTIWSTGRPA